MKSYYSIYHDSKNSDVHGNEYYRKFAIVDLLNLSIHNIILERCTCIHFIQILQNYTILILDGQAVYYHDSELTKTITIANAITIITQPCTENTFLINTCCLHFAHDFYSTSPCIVQTSGVEISWSTLAIYFSDCH